jgi:hypothetical protein
VVATLHQVIVAPCRDNAAPPPALSTNKSTFAAAASTFARALRTKWRDKTARPDEKREFMKLCLRVPASATMHNTAGTGEKKSSGWTAA